jgi:glycosyltransferase involved in cell wall biosynthesis
MGAANRRDRPFIAQARSAAREAFHERYGTDFRFAPILVLIAAYEEEQSLGEVLSAIPATVHGLGVETVVVDDGSTDATASVAETYDRVRVARLPRNCGQGVALRLGYQLAAEHGAEYIATVDGDMQWDPAELPVVMDPLLDGEADFVLGSRALGSAETDDSLRHAGVRFFAVLTSLLTGVRLTDTSTGYRAMRAEVPQTVTQTQVQYQTSELLIGAIYQGYRITERPITMHKRFAGESKKGHNVLYGFRYARVILGTWHRERSRARRCGRPDTQETGREPGRVRAVRSFRRWLT